MRNAREPLCFGDRYRIVSLKSQAPLRRGLSLTEVLISMFVLLIGLMGVAAMFPVGSYYMVRGEQLDRGAAVAQAAANEMVARGLLDPSTWIAINGGKIVAPPSAPVAKVTNIVGIVIDPLGIAAAVDQSQDDASFDLLQVGVFPRDDAQKVGVGGVPVRVTVPVPIPKDPRMPLEIADLIFRSRDDLTFALPEQADQPARQLFDDGLDGNGDLVPLRRQTAGEYSWLATIGPQHNSQGQLVTGDPRLEHKVSIVVFHKRNLVYPTGTGVETELNERQVFGEILAAGPDGGEVRLRTDDPRELNGMRAGEWVLMFGPYALSRPPQERRWFMDWYRIVAMDLGADEAFGSVEEGTRVVSLKGPRWPYSQQDYQRMVSDPTLLPRVGLVSGAISVHTKTMRLESPSSWSVGR